MQLSACKTQKETIKPRQTANTALVESAKRWFDTQQNQMLPNVSLARSSSSPKLSKNVKWATARTYKHIGKEVVEVDVESTINGKHIALQVAKTENVDKSNFYAGITRLVMYKQRDGISFNTYLMVAVGKENYYTSNPNRMQLNQQNSWDNNFSGWVMFFDWNENFVNGYELENGHIVRVSQKEKKNEVARTESTPQNVCQQVWVHLGWDCYYDNPDDPIYTPPPSQSPPTQSPPPPLPQDPSIPIPTRILERQIICQEIGYYYLECWTIIPPNNGGGGGSGAGGTNPPPTTPPPYVPPLYPTPDMDCQGCWETFRDNPEICDDICNGGTPPSDEDFAYDDHNGVRIHGSIGQNGRVLNVTTKIIDNSVVRNEIINEYLNTNPKLTIKMKPMGLNDKLAQTSGNVITLNADRIDKLTDIEIAMVIIHEMIHARWARTYTLTPQYHPELSLHYQMYPPSSFYRDHDYPQHNAMADMFLDTAMRALQEFDTRNANNPQITEAHYKALFLIGLLAGRNSNGKPEMMFIREWELLGRATQSLYLYTYKPQLINTY